MRETSGSRFFLYTRGVGVYCALRSHFCGRFVFPVSFSGTRGVGGLPLRCPRSARGRVIPYRPSSLSTQTPRPRPIRINAGVAPAVCSSLAGGFHPPLYWAVTCGAVSGFVY